MNTQNDINSQIADCRPVVYQCEECGEPIREGDGFYVVNDDYYCENCIERNHYYADVNVWEDDYD